MNTPTEISQQLKKARFVSHFLRFSEIFISKSSSIRFNDKKYKNLFTYLLKYLSLIMRIKRESLSGSGLFLAVSHIAMLG
jgi:hypothetical protein